MNLIVNLIPIKKGGGQQVASNFINQSLKNKNHNILFLVTSETYCHTLLKDLDADFISINNSISSRIFFQYFKLPFIIKRNKTDVLYTMFGPGLNFKNIISITGCAYSNIFYPEIDFWSDYSFKQRIKLKLIDYYRLKTTLASDAIIFENRSMQERSIKLYNFPKERTKLILPSISDYKFENNDSFVKSLNSINSNNFNILLLTGWHKNKNIEIVPLILYEIQKQGRYDISFVITVHINHPDSVKLYNEAVKLKVDKNIVFLGSVEPHNIPNLFQKIQAVGLFSLLESFSNNIIESWYFKKPLFISNEEWSKSICNEAAIYVQRDDPKDISNKILEFLDDNSFKKNLKKQIENELLKYPDPREKVIQQFEFIEEIYQYKNG
ncbi:glycosyltransferase [Croceibacter atlanticus]|uniref:glycosyltransferase n=1 Tax=Croceibacter atlanticus TaxID=313588 RepID=UPI002E0E7A63|nr:glycosyltransferase [Croceibacter atlanticus]